MKTVLMTVLMLTSINTFAASNLKTCYAKAASVTEKFAGEGYDQNGFSTFNCEQTQNKAAIACDVAASKGDGAATDTYRAILSLDCKNALRVELTGEE